MLAALAGDEADGIPGLLAPSEAREREVGPLADQELAAEYAVLREWGERTRERLGV